MRRLLLSLALVSLSANAYATSPCMTLKEAQFAEKVIKPADLVVEGTIVDYSNVSAEAPGRSWTKIHPERQLYGKMPDHDFLVYDWQAYSLPFFSMEKGTPVILILKHQDDGYVMTDAEWKECVPSLINVKPDIVVSTGLTPLYVPDHPWIALEEFEQYIQTHHH